MILQSKSIVVNKSKGGKGKNVFDAQESPPESCWRLVHVGAKVIALFESSGITWTKSNLFCATTKQECLDEIAWLKLAYVPEENIEVSR